MTMTMNEIVEAIKRDTPFNRARKELRLAMAGIALARPQLLLSSPVETRRMEFEAVRKIAAALGVEIDDNGTARIASTDNGSTAHEVPPPVVG